MRDFIDLGMTTPQKDLDALVELAKQVSIFNSVDIVEVGSWTGRTALNFLQSAGVTKVYCVDHWNGSPGDPGTDPVVKGLGWQEVFKTFCANTKRHLYHSIFPCMGSSLLWAKVFPFQVDMVFLDGDHRYESVKADIEAWEPVVREGGLFVCHDFASSMFPGVTKAVVVDYRGEKYERAGETLAYWRVERKIAEGSNRGQES